MSLMSELTSRRSPVMSKSSPCCSGATPIAVFFPTGIGMNDSLGRRPSFVSPVGPFGPMTKWRCGASYGEVRIGLSRLVGLATVLLISGFHFVGRFVFAVDEVVHRASTLRRL